MNYQVTPLSITLNVIKDILNFYNSTILEHSTYKAYKAMSDKQTACWLLSKLLYEKSS